MSDWPGLVAAAVVGTARRPPPSAEPPALAAVDGTEAGLLAAAAVAAITRRAGRRPTRRERALPEPAPADSRPPASAAATDLLGLILAGDVIIAVDDLLAEWLERCAASGRRLPGGLVPTVLDRATAWPLLRPAAATGAGPLGAWLGARRPEWEWATGNAVVPADPEALVQAVETGTRSDRMIALRRLRPLSPSLARLKVEQAWKGEPAAERATLLAVLGEGLTADDEGFLERALDDRAAAVRSTAAALLDRLPGSARAARMADRLRPLVRVTPGRDGQPAIATAYPTEPDPAGRRDGITDRPPEKMGTRAWWLLQISGGAPLGFWAGELGLDPETTAAAAARGDDAGPELLAGLERATLAQGDQRWAAALFPFRPTPALAAAMVPGAAAAAVAEIVKGRAEPDRRLPALLAAVPGPWPPSLSREVLARYLRLGGRAVFELADALPLLAARLGPIAAPAVGAWADSLDTEGLRRSVRRLQHTLSIRQQIAVELL